jgi:DNA-cytosine methyltransferase
MNVLSLFDGISCGQLALQRAGIMVNEYYASEIDKYAIKVTQKNFPNTFQMGSVLTLRSIVLPKIDLVIGGSPCQGFSFAGKQLNFEDPRSKLFFEYVRLLNLIKIANPSVKFLLENVRMKKEYQDIISEHLGVQPIPINSALVSAQNRQRLYWTNIEGVVQPEDRGIKLQDILEHGVVDRDKSFCIDANYWKGTTLEQYLTKSRRQIVFTERRTEEAKQIRKDYMKKYGKDFSPRRGKELVPREDDKANCLTTSLTKEHILLDEQNKFRKLTPIECERLQTVPDDYTKGISNTQRYKCLGNGWTVDVVAHIFKNLK